MNLFSGGEPYRIQKDGPTIYGFIHITSHHPHFEGHFDKLQIFPGASQVGMVIDLLSEHYQRPVKLRQVMRAKFCGMIVPGMHLKITVTPQNEQVQWLVETENKTLSKGVLAFA